MFKACIKTVLFSFGFVMKLVDVVKFVSTKQAFVEV